MTKWLPAQIVALMRMEAFRYFLVSGAAFAIDFLFFVIAFRVFDFSVYLAATIGFVVGGFFAYLASIKIVFSYRAMEESPGREFGIFLLVGVLGLLTTQVSLYLLIEIFSLNEELSRIISAAISFLFNYLLRKVLLFTNISSGIRV